MQRPFPLPVGTQAYDIASRHFCRWVMQHPLYLLFSTTNRQFGILMTVFPHPRTIQRILG